MRYAKEKFWLVESVTMRAYLFTAIFILGFYFTSAAQCRANSNLVFISEVYPAPSSQETEWVELYNPASIVATLSGYLLYDQLSSPSPIATIPTVEIPALSTIVLDLESQKLNNSGDAVVLYDELGQEVDRLTFGSNSSQQSWSKTTRDGTPLQGAPTKGIFVPPTSVSATPTVTLASPTPNPSIFATPPPQYSSFQSILLTEVMSCPNTGESEWLELYNPGSIPITVGHWLVSDAQANHAEIDGFILPNSYTVFSWPKAMLNNQGDSLLLQTDVGQTVATLQLPSCMAGQAFSISDGVAVLSQSPSPGKENPTNSATTTDSQVMNAGEETATKSAVPNSDQEKNADTIFSPSLLSLTIQTLAPQLYAQTKIAQVFQPNHSINWMLYGTIASSVIAIFSLFLLYYDFTQ